MIKGHIQCVGSFLVTPVNIIIIHIGLLFFVWYILSGYHISFWRPCILTQWICPFVCRFISLMAIKFDHVCFDDIFHHKNKINLFPEIYKKKVIRSVRCYFPCLYAWKGTYLQTKINELEFRYRHVLLNNIWWLKSLSTNIK